MADLQWHVLDDGRAGHVNQSWGLVQQFDPHLQHAGSSRLPAPRSWLKRPLQLLLRFAGKRPGLLGLLYLAYYRSPPPPRPAASLLLSTGGDTLVANVILARLWHMPNIFIGKESRLTAQAVALLVTTAEGPQLPHVLRLPLAPVRPAAATPDPDTTPPSCLPLIAVLIGGDSQEYQYGQTDYEALADALNALCRAQGWRLLLTTSRRTGALAEATLKSHLDPTLVTEATWYAEQPRPTAGLYSMRADVIFCSEDSGSMLTESLSYGKPVVAFHPRARRLSAFYQRFLERLASHGVTSSAIPALRTCRLCDLQPAQRIDYSRLTSAILRLTEPR